MDSFVVKSITPPIASLPYITDPGPNNISASSKELSESVNKTDSAKKVGKLVAERALALGVSSIVFDRSGYLYHGRVKSLAEGAREGGLNF